jgi:Tetratricopeptide repeat
MIIEYTGIIRYLPPELVMPLATIQPTPESDMYALGCLGLEVRHHSPISVLLISPFQFIYLAKPYAHHGEDYRGQILKDIYAGIPPAIRQEDAHLPLDIRWGNTSSWELIEALWCKQAGARPTASYVLTLIDHIVGETNDMVTIFAEQCRWADAERSQQDVLEQQRNLLGPEHPRAIEEAMTLASIYVEQEKWVEAEGLQLDILECQRRILGKDHLDAIRAAANLASTHHMQGNWNEARNMKLEILEQRQRILGEDHPYTILAVESLNATCKAPEEVEAANNSLRALVDVDSDSPYPL